MLHLFQALSRLLANYTSIFVIGVAVFTFFFPHTFDWVRGITQTVILGIIMLTMGLTLTTNDFKILAQRPLDVFIGACAQFIIMPGVAYTPGPRMAPRPCPGPRHPARGLLSWRRVEQHHELSLPWRRGFLCGNDLCLHHPCSCDDSAADEDYGWRDHPCRCRGHVHRAF